MTTSQYLKRFPNARPSTVAYLMLRDEKTAQLQRELREVKKAKGWSIVSVFRNVAAVLRGEVR